MKIAIVMSPICLYASFFVNAGQDVALPKIKAKMGIDVIQAIESRSASSNFNGNEGLNLPTGVEPLTILSFGYSE